MKEKKASIKLSDGTIKLVDFIETPIICSEEEQLLVELDEDNLQNVLNYRELIRYLKGKNK